MPGTIIASIIGAGTSLYISDRQNKAAQDQYEAQYAAEQQAAIANAQAALTAAEAEAEAILGSAGAQAHSVKGQAEAEGKAIVEGALAESGAARSAADVAYQEAYKNIGLMKAEANETLRKLELEQKTYEEKARAKAAASGGQYAGSQKLYVEGMEAENQAQYGYLAGAYQNQRKVAASNAAATRGAAYGYADATMKAAEARKSATLRAGDLMAAAYMEGAYETAEATKDVANAQWGATIQTYGGPTSGKWFDVAYQNAAAARKRGQPFNTVLDHSQGYGYAAAKAYGRV